MKLIKRFWPLILLFILSFFTFYRLLRPGYFSMMDDMHLFRLDQFDQCLKDGQIPCRFIKDGGLGYGYPLFNFYPPLAYIVAEFFNLLGFSLINSLKITFILPHLIGVFGLYFFAKLYFNQKAAFLSALLFLFAPYQATDSFVRGAIAESLALNLLPWIFYYLTLYLKNQKHKVALVISLSLLLLSHNLISVAIAPFLIIYSLLVLKIERGLTFKALLRLALLSLLSFGLSAFFILPALFEKNLTTVNTMTQGYFQYHIHFATLNQLFISRFWGFGASLWGPIDDMAFSLGHLHWILAFTSLSLLFTKKNKVNKIILLFFFVLFLFTAFLTHNKSTFIWQALPFMAFFQFPWRFLSLSIFALSFIGGSVILLVNKKYQTLLLVVLSTLTVLLNFSYFKEDIWFPNLTDHQKLSGKAFFDQSAAGLKDYWPNYSTSFPSSLAPDLPLVKGDANISNYQKKSNRLEMDIEIKTPSTVTLPLVYFPNWQLYLDGQLTSFKIDKSLGLITFDLKEGNYFVQLLFKNTSLRSVANLLSFLSAMILIFISLKFKDET